MPILLIRTNISRSKIPDALLSEATHLLVEILNRPVSGFSIIVQPDTFMIFGGTNEPCASCVLQDFDHFDAVQNKRIAGELMPFLYEKLGVDKKRMYLEFVPVMKENIGFAADTFHTFFGPENGVGLRDSYPDKTFTWPDSK